MTILLSQKAAIIIISEYADNTEVDYKEELTVFYCI